MKVKPITWLQEQRKSTIWLLAIFCSVILSELMASCLEKLFTGQVTNVVLVIALITSIVVSAIIVGIVVYFLDYLHQLQQSNSHLKKIIDQRNQAYLQKKKSISILQATLESTKDAILVVDLNNNWVLHNQQFISLWQLPTEIINAKSDKDALDFVLNQLIDADIFLTKVLSLYATPDCSSSDTIYFKDGKVIERYSIPQRIDGKVVGRVWSFRDVTERKRVENKLHLAASVFTHANEAILITNSDGIIIDVNNAFSQITGYSREDILGFHFENTAIFQFTAALANNLWKNLLEKGYWHSECWNLNKKGEPYAILLTISSARDADDKIRHYVILFSDITALKKHEQELEHSANYDALTNLPNRTLLATRLQEGMLQTLKNKQLLVVIYVDLDGFKQVNDIYGHEVGDQLLITVSSRMKTALREGDTLARLGGDEFVAVLLNLENFEASLSIFSRLLEAASKPLIIDGLPIKISASIGVSYYPQLEDVDADLLLRQADQAMYQAKLTGKNRYQIFDAEQAHHIRNHHDNLNYIRVALNKRQFILYYQPKVNIRTGAIIGVEALIRWQHPEKGLLPPSEFLPFIENHPLAIDIGEWVIQTALAQIQLWQLADLNIAISVNVSASQLQQADFISKLRATLALYPSVKANFLELEVLETSALEDVAHVSKIIQSCLPLGVQFALDDFGTGYSSLTYLKHLPVALLKIDQSFVRNMLEDSDDLAIVEGVLGLAKAFKRAVIAEGVETVDHGKMLLNLGCELAQGYGIARPMPADQVLNWYTTWPENEHWLKLRES